VAPEDIVGKVDIKIKKGINNPRIDKRFSKNTIFLKTCIKDKIKAKIQLKLDDNITTDDIIPAGANVLPLRSNLPKISEYTFKVLDPEFITRIKKDGTGIIIGGLNYGQGSSREHAALTVMYLGVKAIIVKSFARIHRDNLINCGILPLTFKNEEDFNRLEQGDILELNVDNLNLDIIKIRNNKKNIIFEVKHDLDDREKEIIKTGGILPYYRNKKLD